MRISISRIFFLILSFYSFYTVAFSQSFNLPAGNAGYHFVDRLEIKSGRFAPFHTAHKYYDRADVVRYALSLDTLQALSWQNVEDLNYLYRDNNQYLDSTAFASQYHPKYQTTEKPFLKYFLKTPANFYEYTTQDFNITYQPSIALGGGFENTEVGNNPYFFRNFGGIINGSINDRVHFYSNFMFYFDRYQAHVRRYIEEYQAVPGHGFYNDGYTLSSVDSLYDNFNAQAYIDFKATKNIQFEFGHGKNFIGNGARSMLLSDFSDNYLYLKINTKFGLFDYQNIFAELRQFSTKTTGFNIVAPKYLASHHLSFNISPNFNVGVFEAVIANRDNGFELNYLNPIIFYRSIERDLSSPDNVLIGADFKWNFSNRFSLYGQGILDELQRENFFGNGDWWANKYGVQLGAKYIDVFDIDHLDLQVEYNYARPYTYSHSDSVNSYSHGSQPLAHPLGANFREWLAILRYQPTSKLFLTLSLMQANVGRDSSGINYGGNILRNYGSRPFDDGVLTGQGVGADIFLLDLRASYMLIHNMFVDLNLQYRTEDSGLEAYDHNQFFFSLGFRYNLWSQPLLF